MSIYAGVVCSIEDCDRQATCRGWCNRHYSRWNKHGDPLAVTGIPRNETRIERLSRYTLIGDDCWPWTGHLNRGYGRLKYGGQQTAAHRAWYEELVGPIPEGLHLDHLCRVRHCVNPDHLEPVTPEENTQRAQHCVGCTCET